MCRCLQMPSHHLHLELQAVVSQLRWPLGTRLTSSGRATALLSTQAPPQPISFNILFNILEIRYHLILKIILFYVYIWLFSMHVPAYHICAWCPKRTEEGVRYSRAGVADGCGLLCRCSQTNPGPLEEQQCSSLLSRFSSCWGLVVKSLSDEEYVGGPQPKKAAWITPCNRSHMRDLLEGGKRLPLSRD